MKKIISIVTVLVLSFALLLPISVSAAGASATLIGPAAVHAGDTITLTLNLNGSGLFGASGTLSYDASQVTLTDTKQTIASPWMVEFNGNNFVTYDNNLSNPIKGNASLFTLTFKVKNVAKGTKIKISCTELVASDGTADANIGTVTYEKVVTATGSADDTPQEPSNDASTKDTTTESVLTDNTTTEDVSVDSTTTEDTLTDNTTTEDVSTGNTTVGARPKGGIAWWWILIAVVGLTVGVVGCWFLAKSKR